MPLGRSARHPDGSGARRDTRCAAAAGSVLYYDGFDGANLDENPATGWAVSTGPAFGYGTKSQAYMLRANLYTAQGMLHLTTRRHCVGSAAGIPSPSNERAAACGQNQVTKYSAARVDSRYRTPYGVNWEIRISAQLPGRRSAG